MADDLAPMKEQVYTDPRAPEYFERFHARARRRGPDWVYDLARLLLTPVMYLLYRARSIASDHVPPEGPVIVAPNHFSFMDHFFIAMFLRRRVRFMAKSQLFKRPMQFIYHHGGVFPVRRGARDEEAFITAHSILRDGGLIVMYCEGGRSRTGRLASRARRGIGRLALENGVPIVPVAIHGSSKIRNWRRLQLPKVTVQFGRPIRWEAIADPTRDQQQAIADEVLGEIKAIYAGLEQVGRRRMIRRVREQRRLARRGERTAAAST
ncbi:MAG: 1-acyl-sn-glycerol-3-phosphate acyltransferase [Actinobacteria bacterium]|nr:MAG: 1-acyl-sn-glycerol-3-phosphate acyltransferase [Actinomycetota bacterium]